MANRFFNQFRMALEKQAVDIFGLVTFGAAGAPTLNASLSKGIVSVTRNAAGKFTFVFGTQAGMLDVYNKLLNINFCFDTTGAAGADPAAPDMYITANNIAVVGTSSIQLTFNAPDGATSTDPASGEILRVTFTFKNSTAP